MNQRLIAAGICFVLATGALAVCGHPQHPSPAKTSLKVGDLAPDFTLVDQDRKPVKLSDFRGKQNVVLAFYTLAFTGG